MRAAIAQADLPDRRRKHLLLQTDDTLLAIVAACEANPGAVSAVVHASLGGHDPHVSQDTVYWLRRALSLRGAAGTGRKPGPQPHDPTRRNLAPPSAAMHGPAAQDHGGYVETFSVGGLNMDSIDDPDVGWDWW